MKFDDALLARGADEQVGVGHAGGVEALPRSASSSIVLRRRRPARTSSADRARRAHDLRAAAVGDEEIEHEPVVAARCAPSRATAARCRRRQARRDRRARCTRTPCVGQLVALARDVLLEQRHERLNSRDGPLPVLLREREEREHLERQPRSSPRRPRAPPSSPSDGRADAAASRSRAQRPLPSMMIATCRGMRAVHPRIRASISGAFIAQTALHFHDLGFFRLDQLVDLVRCSRRGPSAGPSRRA